MSLTKILVLMKILYKRERFGIAQTRETRLLKGNQPRRNRRIMWFPFSTRKGPGISTSGLCCLCSMIAVVTPLSLPCVDYSDHHIGLESADERAVSVLREFGSEPFQIGTNGLMGCTVVILVSKTHVWMVSRQIQASMGGPWHVTNECFSRIFGKPTRMAATILHRTEPSRSALWTSSREEL